MNLTPEQIRAAVAEHGSIRRAAPHLGVDERTVRRHLARIGGAPTPERAPRAEKARMRVSGDEASFTTPASPDIQLGDLDKLMRDRGLDPAQWEVVTATLNEWEALGSAPEEGAENPVRTLRQMKVQLRRKITLALLTPARDIEPVKRKPARRPSERPQLVVVEGDHQVPYHDPELHAASLAMLSDVDPDGHVFLGDTLDFPTISRHPDHPAAAATPQECLDLGVRLLRDKREAAPRAWAKKLEGNHDARLATEQLTRAERTYGIRPGAWDDEEQLDAFSLRRLLHLDRLAIEHVTDPRGWQHGEVVLVPGPNGLVVRHGFVTGANTAGRTMRKLGRSAIVGHDHGKDHAYWRDPSAGTLRQAVVAGTMSRCDEVFPHFAVMPDWHQGFVTVTIWPSGRFVIEHALWQDGALYWRDRAWRP